MRSSSSDMNYMMRIYYIIERKSKICFLLELYHLAPLNGAIIIIIRIILIYVFFSVRGRPIRLACIVMRFALVCLFKININQESYTEFDNICVES